MQWFKINQTESINTTFTLKLAQCPKVKMYGTQFPQSTHIKQLRLTLVRHLTQVRHIKVKGSQLKYRLLTLKTLNVNSKHSKSNTKLGSSLQITFYSQFGLLACSQGLQLRGNGKISNLNKIQIFQNITLRKIINCPPYLITSFIKTYTKKKKKIKEVCKKLLY